MKQYHLAKNGQQIEGLFTESDLLGKLQSGELSPTDLCWTEGMSDWQPLGSVIHSPVAAPRTTVYPPQQGLTNPYAPPRTHPTSPAMAGLYPGSSGYQLASPLLRLGAVLVESLILMVLCIPLIIADMNSNSSSGPEFSGFSILSVVLLVAYAIYNLISLATRGQSIGKRIVGIRIVTYPDCQNPGGVKTIVLRGFVNGLIGAVPLLGGIYSLVDTLFIFSEGHRCLHDRIAGTMVVVGQPPGI